MISCTLSDDLQKVRSCIHNASLLMDYDSQNQKYFIKENIWHQCYEIGINYTATEAQENLLLQLQKEFIKEKEKQKQKNNGVIFKYR